MGSPKRSSTPSPKSRVSRVAARTSSFAFKGKTPDVTEVSAHLRVATVLEGSVRKAGDRIRIDRKSTRLNSSHGYISYAVFCLKKKKSARRPAHRTRARPPPDSMAEAPPPHDK